jgi:hypothetical protein
MTAEHPPGYNGRRIHRARTSTAGSNRGHFRAANKTGTSDGGYRRKRSLTGRTKTEAFSGDDDWQDDDSPYVTASEILNRGE